MRNLLLIKNIKVRDANALSSPYTAGFPAMTAWLGFMHALQRCVCKREGQEGTQFRATAVVCHNFNMRAVKDRFILPKRSPLIKEDAKKISNGKAVSIIPDPKCHLEVSLLIEHNTIEKQQAYQLCEQTESILPTMRIAGGDILQFDKIQSEGVDENAEGELRKLTRQLMPGYFIKERRDLMRTAMQEGQDALDALLSYLVVTNKCDQDDGGDVTWRREKKAPGWLVPIATGFHGITELGKVKGQRDNDTPHRFAEAVVTLGEFVMPYRAKSLDDMLWHYHVDKGNDLYLCQQQL